MRLKSLSAVRVIVWAVVAVCCAPQGTSATPQSSLAKAADQQPGEDEYHAPFPAPATDSSADFRDKYFLGDWMGVRSKLAGRGIRFALLTITDPFGNITGGRQSGASNYNLVGFGVLLDMNRVLGWHGGTFHVGFAANCGTSLSTNYVGNSFPVQLADVADAHPRLTYLSFTQEMLEGKLSIRLGRLTINSVSSEEFMGSEYFKAFSSVGIDLVPLGVFLNAPGAFGYPDTTWGARIKFQPVKRFYTMVGAYNGDPTLKNGVHHGLDFSMRGPLFLIAEVGFRRPYSKGLPSSSSNLKFGGYYNAGTFTVFGSGGGGRQLETAGGHYGLYVVGDQVLWRFGDTAQRRRLGAFGAITLAPDQRINKVPYFFDTGLVAHGPLRSRPKDFLSFAVVYGSYSGDLRQAEKLQPNSSIKVQQFEMALEWNYGVAIKPGLLLQPDVQYLIHPNGNKATPNALAIGLNIVVNW